MRFPGIRIVEQTERKFRRFESVIKKEKKTSDFNSRALLLIKAPTKKTILVRILVWYKNTMILTSKLPFQSLIGREASLEMATDPENHLAEVLEKLGDAHSFRCDFNKALSFYGRALDSRTQHSNNAGWGLFMLKTCC